jgi:agmatinase
VAVFEHLSIVDRGDVTAFPGDTARTVDIVSRSVKLLLSDHVVPVVLGGDNTITAGILAAHAAISGPVAVVLLDAHADTLQEEEEGWPFSHGTWLRRAVESGWVLPRHSVLAGMRGSILDAAELEWPRTVGFDVISCDELRTMPPEAFGNRVRERLGGRTAHLTIDIDVVDPAFAPGTGTPEVGGLASYELLTRVRSLRDIEFRGFDIVEVSPPYDNAGETTALLAATTVYEFLALVALAHGTRHDEGSSVHSP